jgi:hypothetical protein
MAHGGARPGSGRKLGAATAKTREIANGAAEAGETPLEFMLRVMRDTAADMPQRLDMVDLGNKDDKPFEQVIRGRRRTRKRRPTRPRGSHPLRPASSGCPSTPAPRRWRVAVAHRRAGKTVALINECIKGALTCPLPKPRFSYIAPFLNQSKAIAWDYLKHYAGAIPGVQFNEAS